MKSKLILFLLFLYGGNLFSQAVGDYRSAASGTWATIANWQTWNGAAWVAAGAAPTSANGVITIQSGHTLQIAANLTIDQVVINSGGTVNWTAGTCTIAAGAGVDLQIDGTFWDNRASATVSITFSVGATWQMGATGTLIRSAGNSSNNWQNAYQGGIANIPSTAFWILRKTGAQNPTISTTAPASGSVYPNLIIENNTGATWTTTAGSTFNGAAAFPTVKGYLDIGGTGTNTVDFLNDCQNATPTTVNGNVTVRTGSTLRNYGTGLRIGGNITISGTVSYDSDHNRLIELNGTANQNITATGTFGIYNFTMNKASGTTTLNNTITVNNTATFTQGILTSTLTNLFIIAATGTVTGASNISFVDGPVRYLGTAAFTFPVGKIASYRLIEIGAGAGGGGTFWTENFNTGAAGWNFNVVTGAEGVDANYWDLDDDEGGVAPPGCGVANNGNPTLHITSVFNPAGGAAYDAGGLCGFLFCPQADRRTESPTINCTGRSNIYVGFNYIENGQAALDNATIWYFDGAAWSLLEDMPKTLTGCGGQGIWTARTVNLPASSYNNPNVKIAFRWVNNDDGAGTDPSFAVDDVYLAEAAPATSFTAEYFPNNPQVPYGNLLAPTLTTLSNCEYWILSRDVGSEARTVKLSWDAASCNITNLADLRVARHDGISTWQDHGNGGTTGNTTAGTVITSAVVTTFSPFAIANVTPLPVELLYFDANADGNKSLLTWETASEINNDFFTIERSMDGINFYPLSEVDGAGNSNLILSYKTYDTDPITGLNYYRLKQTDFDGTVSYSEIRTVQFGVSQNLQLVNAFENGELISFYCTSSREGEVLLDICDMSGRTVYSGKTICGSRIDIPKTNISSGIYLIRISDGVDTDLKKLFVR